MRPPASAYPDGRAAAPRRASGGRRRKGARGAARPSSSILPPGRETERARERRSAPERGDRAERERERGFGSSFHPPPRESTSSHDGTGACHSTRARPAIARGRRRHRRRRPRRLPRAVPTRGLAKARMGGATEDGAGPAGERKAAAPPRSRRGASPEERRSPPSGDGQRDLSADRRWISGTTDGRRHRRSERARACTPATRPSEKSPRRSPRCGRGSPTLRVVREKEEKEDKPLCRGLTLNRSQRGSCSATYETPTQKQVVYEWFSARFHTNVRST